MTRMAKNTVLLLFPANIALYVTTPIFAPVVECIDNRSEFPISEAEVQINSNLVTATKDYQITG